MELFKGFRERRAQRTQHAEELKRLAHELEKRMAQIEVFPGTKAEYEKYKSEKFEYIGTGINGRNRVIAAPWENPFTGNLVVYCYNSIFEKALSVGAEAIVQFKTFPGLFDEEAKGIPVKRQEKREVLVELPSQFSNN
ncbi:MAG: hypothetical protein AAB521_02720 [Patescibacteria group bacterium]